MFEDVIRRLYEIGAPRGANTQTPVAGEFALYEAERVAEMGTSDKSTLIGQALLKFQSFNKGDIESLQMFKEILEGELKKVKEDNWILKDKLRALRGIWLTEARLIRGKKESIICIRVTQKEKEWIEEEAKKRSTSVSEFIREKILE